MGWCFGDGNEGACKALEGGFESHPSLQMTLIVHPHTYPVDERHEFKTMFHVQNNMGCFKWFDGRGYADVQEWIDEQSFKVVMYRGWWHTFFFDHPHSFLLTKMMYPNYSWSCHYNQPEEFMPFYREWRKIYDAKQAAYIEKIRREREANGTKD